jgi:hypothetical protein
MSVESPLVRIRIAAIGVSHWHSLHESALEPDMEGPAVKGVLHGSGSEPERNDS